MINIVVKTIKKFIKQWNHWLQTHSYAFASHNFVMIISYFGL
jgi:cellulose synthase/poly-beta-1,6-N-acetylglucosamine synthase-like glycosyltransferase